MVAFDLSFIEMVKVKSWQQFLIFRANIMQYTKLQDEYIWSAYGSFRPFIYRNGKSQKLTTIPNFGNAEKKKAQCLSSEKVEV